MKWLHSFYQAIPTRRSVTFLEGISLSVWPRGISLTFGVSVKDVFTCVCPLLKCENRNV